MHPTIYPSDWLFRSDPPPLEQFGRRFLSEGDSWFTIGSLNLPQASNLLNELQFAQTTAIVNCAYPGDTLQHIVDNAHDPYFDRLLRAPRFASYWEAILFSAGGNDLIDAAQHRAVRKNGSPAALNERILLTPAEAAAANPGRSGADRFVSEPGWALFAGYIKANFADLVRRRDQGPSAGRPIFVHTYHVPVVRAAGTVGAPQGWLYPALRDVGIPAAERQAVAAELFERLRALLLVLDMQSGEVDALPQFHVFDSATRVALSPSDPDATGNSGDWINEIHPNPGGYAKVGRAMGAWIDDLLDSYP